MSSAVAAGVVVNIADGGGANDSQLDPTPAFAGISFESDGDVMSTTVAGSVDAGDWIAPKAAAPGAYQIMAHQNSGDALDVGSDALDTWLALTSARAWQQTQTGAGSKSANLTVSIRLGSTVLSSGVFTLAAQVT
jgi:hypothetical protein